jgi:hypothetical protein
MSTSEVRYCNAADWPAMIKLRMGRKTHAGNHVTAFTTAPISHVSGKYLLHPNIVVGAWLDGRLAAYICAYAHKDFWVLDLMISSGDPKPLRDCLNFCLEHYEAYGIKQFYYAFPKKWARAYKSFWKEGIPRLQPYIVEDVHFIEANTVVEDPFIWKHIVHEMVLPVPFLLRRSYVK